MKFAAVVSILALSTVSATAADLAARAYTKAPVPVVNPIYDWSGFYVGGTAGGAFGSFDPSTSTTLQTGGYLAASGVSAVNAAGAQSIKPVGFTGGFEAGYNWQVNNFVVGFEGDVEYLGLKGSASTVGVYPTFAPATFNVTSNASTTWLATARARAGIAANDWLFFATGGAAFTNTKANFGFSDNCASLGICGGQDASEATALSSTKTGFAVGAGVEKAIGQNWTVKAEYLYVDFGTITGTGNVFTGPGLETQLMTHSYDLKANLVRLGINYKFGGPVVAKY